MRFDIKIYVIVILCLLSMITQAQNIKLQFGIEPLIAHRILNFKNSKLSKSLQEKTSDLEIFKFGGGSTFYLDWAISEQSSLKFGLGYRLSGWQTKKYTPFIDVWDVSPANNIKQEFYHIHQIVLPIYYSKQMSSKTPNLSLTGGIILTYSPNFIRQKNHLSENSGKLIEIDPNQWESFPKFNLGFRLGLSQTIIVNSKFSFEVEPFIEFGLRQYDTELGYLVSLSENDEDWSGWSTDNNGTSYMNLPQSTKGHIIHSGISIITQLGSRKR